MRRPKAINEPIEKLTVKVGARMLRRVRQEKLDTGMTMEEIVNRRLDLSYQAQPHLVPEREPAPA